jgi:protein-S-isoprenylcysteine O-methyltransferase Ste14
VRATLEAVLFALWTGYLTIPLFWLLVHPFADFWRRARGRTYAAFAVFMWSAMLAAFFYTRPFWTASRFPRSWPVILAGAALCAVEPLLMRKAEIELGMPILVGWAERDPGQFPPRLIDTGVYAHIRHPRYVASMAALCGLSLLTGATRVLWLSLASLPLYWLLTVAEERELRARLGASFIAYYRRVPRFIPRIL